MSTLKVNTIKPQSGTTVAVSGTLEVSGTINAYEFNTITTNAHSGSNVFGNSSGDTHQFTGSIFLSELQLMASGKELQFADDGEHISGDGSTLSIVSEAGSIAIGAALADGQTLKLGKNGAVETIIAPHGTAGNESYSVINTAGDTDGTDAAGAILLSAVAGGIGLAWADGKDLWAEGGRAVITANEDAADCIKLHADAGTSQTITIVNDAGTDAAAIGLTATAGGITFSADTATFASANSTDPLVVIKNTTNDANGARLRFVKDKGAAGAANDVAGLIEFYADDAAQSQVLFAKMEAAVAVHTDGQEGGKLTLGVASHDGEMVSAVTIEDGSAEDEVNVTFASNIIINSETATAPGAGWSAGVTSYVRRLNGEVVTTILVDLGAASAIVPATDGYAVGDNTGEASYLTKLTNAVNGVVTIVEVACVETPDSSGTQVTDLNLHLNSASKNANAQVDTGTHIALLDGGDEDEGWDSGASQGQSIGATGVPTASNAIGLASGGTDWYLYLTAGDSTGNGSDTYTHGKFVITLYGHDF